MKDITINYAEYRKLYRMYCHLESIVEYNELMKEGQDFQFMIDSISERAKETVKEYNKEFESKRKKTTK